MHTDQLVPASTIGAVPAERTVPWRNLAIGAAALVAVSLTAAITWSDGGDSPEIRKPPAADTARTDARARDVDAITRDLAARGLIPAEAVEPAVTVAVMTDVRDTDAITRNLVERGLIPAESLSGG